MSHGKSKRPLTYRDAGVDIDTADGIVAAIKRHAQHASRPEVLSGVGPFGGLFQLKGYRQPVLVASADGVGTKLKVACALNRHETIGIDLVNHCVNDILTCGADPLFFLDYVAMAGLVPETVEAVVAGMSRALKEVGCALLGGETAEMPGLYPQGEYDLAGFIVGAVEREGIVDGHDIAAGDIVVGLPSSGLHTNGYSLVRMVFHIDDDPSALGRHCPELGRTLGDELLQPHRCYYHALKPHITLIKGMAHITGGGLPGNLPRSLPQGLAARIERDSWAIPPIFRMVAQEGAIDEREMYRTFNMGIGMAVVCSPATAGTLTAQVPGALGIGEVVTQKGKERVLIA